MPRDVKVNLMSGSSISISWVAVEGASFYTIDVQPTPTMSNKLTVTTEYAFIDGLLAGQEYVIRVAATVNNVQSAFSSDLKVIPSGAPIIAPAPRVLSYDESSVTLGRRHIQHYRNGHDLTKVVVRVVEEGGAARELEFAVSFCIVCDVVPTPSEGVRAHARKDLHFRLAFWEREGCSGDVFATESSGDAEDIE